MKNIISCFFRSVPLSIALICLGYLIVYLFLSNPQQLEFTLFALGAIPIILFLPSLFSQSRSGALHTPKVIFRKVDSLEKRGKIETETIFPALSYVIAGVLTWLFSLTTH